MQLYSRSSKSGNNSINRHLEFRLFRRSNPDHIYNCQWVYYMFLFCCCCFACRLYMLMLSITCHTIQSNFHRVSNRCKMMVIPAVYCIEYSRSVLHMERYFIYFCARLRFSASIFMFDVVCIHFHYIYWTYLICTSIYNLYAVCAHVVVSISWTCLCV